MSFRLQGNYTTSKKPLMTHLQVGDLAPEFSGLDQHGIEISMDDFVGKAHRLVFLPQRRHPRVYRRGLLLPRWLPRPARCGLCRGGRFSRSGEEACQICREIRPSLSPSLPTRTARSLTPMAFGAARNLWAANTMGSTAKPLSSARMAESSESSTRWTPRTAPAKF